MVSIAKLKKMSKAQLYDVLENGTGVEVKIAKDLLKRGNYNKKGVDNMNNNTKINVKGNVTVEGNNNKVVVNNKNNGDDNMNNKFEIQRNNINAMIDAMVESAVTEATAKITQQRDIYKLNAQNTHSAYKEIEAKNITLKNKNDELKTKNANQKMHIKTIEKDNIKKQNALNDEKTTAQKLKAENDKLKEENDELKARIAELEAKLKKGQKVIQDMMAFAEEEI